MVLRSLHPKGLAGIPIIAVFLFLVLPDRAKIVHKIPGRLFLYSNADFIQFSRYYAPVIKFADTFNAGCVFCIFSFFISIAVSIIMSSNCIAIYTSVLLFINEVNQRQIFATWKIFYINVMRYI